MRFYDQQDVLILKNNRPFYGDISYIYNANREGFPGSRKGIYKDSFIKVPVFQETPSSVWIVENLSKKPISNRSSKD